MNLNIFSPNMSLPQDRVTLVKLATTSIFFVQAFFRYFTKQIRGCKRSDLNHNNHEVNSHMYSVNESTPNDRVTLVKSATTCYLL